MVHSANADGVILQTAAVAQLATESTSTPEEEDGMDADELKVLYEDWSDLHMSWQPQRHTQKSGSMCMFDGSGNLARLLLRH